MTTTRETRSHDGGGQPVIRAQGLTKRFGELEAVKGIDLVVQPGEIFGFLGPNGAGKSTTINMLCTLLKVTAGTASVDGFDVMRQPDDVRSSIGLVFQEASLDLQLTARENLQFHAFVYGVPASQRAARIAQVLEMVELTDAPRPGAHLLRWDEAAARDRARPAPHPARSSSWTSRRSASTRRRADTSGRTSAACASRAGVTLFMTTHYMDEAEDCDRIASSTRAEIVALDTPEELKALVGGDVVTIATNDNAAAAAEIEQHFSVTPVAAGDSLHLEVPEAAAFVPRLVREITVPVTSISFRRPTLDDVFLKLTGHAIRDEAAGANDTMRRWARAWGRPTMSSGSHGQHCCRGSRRTPPLLAPVENAARHLHRLVPRPAPLLAGPAADPHRRSRSRSSILHRLRRRARLVAGRVASAPRAAAERSATASSSTRASSVWRSSSPPSSAPLSHRLGSRVRLPEGDPGGAHRPLGGRRRQGARRCHAGRHPGPRSCSCCLLLLCVKLSRLPPSASYPVRVRAGLRPASLGVALASRMKLHAGLPGRDERSW